VRLRCRCELPVQTADPMSASGVTRPTRCRIQMSAFGQPQSTSLRPTSTLSSHHGEKPSMSPTRSSPSGGRDPAPEGRRGWRCDAREADLTTGQNPETRSNARPTLDKQARKRGGNAYRPQSIRSNNETDHFRAVQSARRWLGARGPRAPQDRYRDHDPIHQQSHRERYEQPPLRPGQKQCGPATQCGN
jgi:hypothetical protein